MEFDLTSYWIGIAAGQASWMGYWLIGIVLRRRR